MALFICQNCRPCFKQYSRIQFKTIQQEVLRILSVLRVQDSVLESRIHRYRLTGYCFAIHSQNDLASRCTRLCGTSPNHFDALNTLQTSTDEKNRLYSTFPNIKQPCYPADTSFEVSQLELQHFMKKFIEQHCQNLTLEHQLELTKSSVLAQQQYTVWYCKEENSMVNYKKGIPMTGTWVMPNVLGRRDVILVW